MASVYKRLRIILLLLLSVILTAIAGISILNSGFAAASILAIVVLAAGLILFVISLLRLLLLKAVEKQTAKLSSELAEKNNFIRDIHHRVKYNFNIMSTLINIQDEQIKTVDDAHHALSDLYSRIKSMSLIHDKLYDADDISRIDMASYFDQLRQQLKTQFPDDASPKITIETEPIFLSINTAVPCGLLVNEIIFLCLSYAKMPGVPLDIEVVMKEEDDNGCSLVITDNGLDMRQWPAAQDVDFSIMLIHQLSGKLHAGIEINYDHGNMFWIEFDSEVR